MVEKAGEALSRSIRAGLPPGVELDEREEALLAAAARQADAVQALEADIAERGYVVGSRLNPSVRRPGRGGRRWPGCWAGSICPIRIR